MLAFELVVMREVSKSNLCFEITLVSFPPEFHFIQYKKKKSTLDQYCIQFFKCISLQIHRGPLLLKHTHTHTHIIFFNIVLQRDVKF